MNVNMKALVKGFARWLIIVLATLCVILWTAIAVHCQYEAARPKDEPDTHPVHKTQEDWEEAIGFRVVEFTNKDNRLLFYKKQLRYKVFLGSFGYNKDTRFDSEKLMDGKFCVLYCKTHSWAYIVSPCNK